MYREEREYCPNVYIHGAQKKGLSDPLVCLMMCMAASEYLLPWPEKRLKGRNSLLNKFIAFKRAQYLRDIINKELLFYNFNIYLWDYLCFESMI